MQRKNTSTEDGKVSQSLPLKDSQQSLLTWWLYLLFLVAYLVAYLVA